MRCPECLFEIKSLPCPHCQERAVAHEAEFSRLVEEFGLDRGEPKNTAGQKSLNLALERLHTRVKTERFNMTVDYEPKDLLCHANWWYIPYCWIGCKGFIVNTKDEYVNWLGSALPLRHCFWGHQHGIVADMVDFTFAPDTDKEVALSLVSRFQHIPPSSKGEKPKDPVWYTGQEIETAFSNQFPVFKDHFVWYCIPELMEASKKHGVKFTCVLSKGPRLYELGQ
jgi:hypothetical protein